jgi:peptide/nickel transport system substrate-binding protein
VYGSVLRYNWEPPLDKLLPDLAESWMAEAGGMKYTFRFRSDVQWHDGRPFTAEDAKFSLALQENRFTTDLSNIERMETPDPFTLVIDLKRAQASFPAYLAIYWEPIFAKHVHEGAGGDLTNGPTVGTGPFKLEEYRPGTSLKMVANPDYFIPEIPYVDSIEYFIISDAGTQQALILAGRLDIIGTAATDMDSEVADSLKGIKSDIQLLDFDVGTVQVIVMNAEASPWDDVRVRRALFLAIDRWRVVDLLPHLAKPTGPLVGPPGWGLSDDELFELPGYRMGAELEEDQEEARRLLAEAGHADGIEADLISSPLPSAGQVREVLVADLAKFGFRLTGSQVPAAEDVARRLARDFELNIQGVGYTVPDPDGASIGVLPGLFTILEDARIAELFEMQSGEIDEARRRGLVVQLQERLLEVAAIVPLAWQKFVWAASPRVRGFHASLGRYTNVRYDRVWLDE